MKLDIDDIFQEFEQSKKTPYKNPMEEPYGDSSKMTRSQRLAWEFLKNRKGCAPVVSMIGAKGSAKTHWGAAFAFHQGQMFPGSMGCVISNTYQQTKDNAGALFMKMARLLQYPTQFFTTKTINGQPYTNIFVVDLDGEGFQNGKTFYLLVRSFDAINKLEGIELDWLWGEELQDAEKSAVITAISRVRGKNADRGIYICGMTGDEYHPMYSVIKSIGAVEENEVRRMLGYDEFDKRKIEKNDLREDIPYYDADVKGIFFEPSIFENRKNLPDEYIPRLYEMYDEVMAKRLIYGIRTSIKGNKILHSYDDYRHRKGFMSQLLCRYDPNNEIIMSIDFNTSPMSATLWQKKEYNSKWDDFSINEIDGNFEILIDGELKAYNHPAEYESPNRTVLAQIDEFEVWEGGTEGLINKFKTKYVNKSVLKNGHIKNTDLDKRRVYHLGGITIIGDATGNRLYSSADKTDWQIIRSQIKDVPNVAMVEGLVSNSNLKSGDVSYSNPPRRATINTLNAALKDANGDAWICFLPQSRYKSGGAARSCSAITKTADGRVDASNDKRDTSARDIPRTHFFDTVRYVVYWFKGGVSAEDFEDMIGEIIMDDDIGTFGRSGRNRWNTIF